MAPPRQAVHEQRRQKLTDSLWIYGTGTVLVVAAFAFAYQFVDPAPPRQVVMTAGEPGGAYHRFAAGYREILLRDGIDVTVRTSAGSVENITRLRDGPGGADVALVQGGLGDPADPDIVALASLYYEPVWIFHRRSVTVADLGDLRGLRVAAGATGSGTRVVARELLAHFGLPRTDSEFLALDSAASATALIGGDVDAIFLVGAADGDPVARLLRTPDITLYSVPRAAAYQRLHPYLAMVTLPAGVVDLASDLPPADVSLLAATAMLVARADLHPALVALFMRAAQELHRRGDLLAPPGSFPAPGNVDFPLSEEAARFFRAGPPFLQRYLPYWAATLVDRLWVMALPLVALLLPLTRLLPPIYRWRVRSRIYRWYRELRIIEERADAAAADEIATLGTALERIEAEASSVSVPWAYAEELYHLRLHIEYVRRRMHDRKRTKTG